jgi:hypothetical protein
MRSSTSALDFASLFSSAIRASYSTFKRASKVSLAAAFPLRTAFGGHVWLLLQPSIEFVRLKTFFWQVTFLFSHELAFSSPGVLREQLALDQVFSVPLDVTPLPDSLV